MPRKPRITIPGSYHILNRGVNREKFFLTDNDKDTFIELLDRKGQNNHIFFSSTKPVMMRHPLHKGGAYYDETLKEKMFSFERLESNFLPVRGGSINKRPGGSVLNR